jgi:hypothetical protein
MLPGFVLGRIHMPTPAPSGRHVGRKALNQMHKRRRCGMFYMAAKKEKLIPKKSFLINRIQSGRIVQIFWQDSVLMPVITYVFYNIITVTT